MTYLIISNDTTILEKIHNFFPNFYNEEHNFRIYSYEKNKFYVPKIPIDNFDKFNYYKKIYQIKNIIFSKIIFLTKNELSFDIKIYLNNLSRKLVKEQSDIMVFVLPNFVNSKETNEIGFKMIFPKAFWNFYTSNIIFINDDDIDFFEPFYFINYLDNIKIKNILKKYNIVNNLQNKNKLSEKIKLSEKNIDNNYLTTNNILNKELSDDKKANINQIEIIDEEKKTLTINDNDNNNYNNNNSQERISNECNKIIVDDNRNSNQISVNSNIYPESDSEYPDSIELKIIKQNI